MAKSLIPLFSVTSQVDTLVFCAYFEKSLYYIGKMERVIRGKTTNGRASLSMRIVCAHRRKWKRIGCVRGIREYGREKED